MSDSKRQEPAITTCSPDPVGRVAERWLSWSAVPPDALGAQASAAGDQHPSPRPSMAINPNP